MSTNVPISSIVLSSSASSITFTNIPQTYTDLVIVVNGGAVTNNVPGLQMQFNFDTTSSYSTTRMQGGSSVNSARNTNGTQIECGNFDAGFPSFANGGFSWICNINGYSNSTTNKTALARYNSYIETVAMVGTWRNTSAINSITIKTPGNGDFASGSTFNLYGINAANSGQAKATGGQTIVRDATHWYHVFNSSGTFTPTQAINSDILVIAGGGGGGSEYYGGGGGAGGVLAHTNQSLTTTNYIVTVGAGGAGASLGANKGASGGNSQFASLTTSVGGGGGGMYLSVNGVGGGSGGGGGGGGGIGGAGTSGQGNAGGNGAAPQGNTGAGGGGGGATGAGGNGATNLGGNGGAGTSSYSTWGAATTTGQNIGGTYWYAGGGGGGSGTGNQPPNTRGTGGNGGGGNGEGWNSGPSVVPGSAGQTNTGGGGGGASNLNIGYAGGSGIIIVRYPV